MARASDVSFTWVDRASARALVLSFASNLVLTAMTWGPVSGYYAPGASRVALALVLGGVTWVTWQVARRVFRRRDILGLLVALMLAQLVLVVAPKTEAAPAAIPWMQGWSTTVVCAALLLVRGRLRWAIVTVSSLLWLALRVPGAGLGVGAVEVAIYLVGGGITAQAVTMAMGRYDRAAAAARVATSRTVEAADASAREEAREWWDRLLHDKVLGALLLISRASGPGQRAQARTLAGEALRELELGTRRALGTPEASQPGTHAETPPDAPPDAPADAPPDLVAGIEAALARHAVQGEIKGSRRHRAPPTVVTAVVAAAEQALSNVARHSGVHRAQVRIHESPTHVKVTVSDTGQGFDPRGVGARRLGVRSSIPGHMALIDGSSTVRSAASQGTTVVLEWRAPGTDTTPAPVSARQVRTWAWLIALFVGLHALGGLFGCARLPSTAWGWALAGMWLAALVTLSINPVGRVLTLAPWVVVLTTIGWLWDPAVSVSGGWHVWFLGASHPATIVPALRGRGRSSLALGTAYGTLTVLVVVLRWPQALSVGLVLGLPLALMPAIAAIYAVMLDRADRRLRAAQMSAAQAQRRLHEQAARQAVLERRLQLMARATLPLLRKVVGGHDITLEDQEQARRAEAANRDQLVAGPLLTAAVVVAVREARARGAVVHLSAHTRGRAGDEATHDAVEQLRLTLIGLLERAGRGDVVTARWQPHSTAAAGTIAAECRESDDEDPRDELLDGFYFELPPLSIARAVDAGPTSPAAPAALVEPGR